MAKFGPAFKRTVMIEGGYSDREADRGGKTKYGISQRSYPDLDIANLTVEEARDIYYRDFWKPFLLEEFIRQSVAEEFFDTGVNMGPSSAIWCAQMAINLIAEGDPLVVDKKMGPKTLAEINKWSGGRWWRVLLKGMDGFQFARYVQIVEEDPSQEANIRGWINQRIGFAVD